MSKIIKEKIIGEDDYRWVKKIVEEVMINVFDKIEKQDPKSGEWEWEESDLSKWINSNAGIFWINALYQVSDIHPTRTVKALMDRMDNRQIKSYQYKGGKKYVHK